MDSFPFNCIKMVPFSGGSASDLAASSVCCEQLGGLFGLCLDGQ